MIHWKSKGDNISILFHKKVKLTSLTTTKTREVFINNLANYSYNHRREASVHRWDHIEEGDSLTKTYLSEYIATENLLL